MDQYAIGIDIGGTKVAAGVVDSTGQVRAQLRRTTPTTSPAAVEDTVADLVTALRQDHPVATLGVGAAGFIDETRSRVLFSPHLAWRNEPLRDALHARTGLPVLVENDANAAAWAEGRFGAARGESVAVCITLGTGLGGGVLLGGQVFRGRHGVAGEFGHMPLVPNGHRCPCGSRGCWEQYASGGALVREARAMMATGESSAPPLLGLAARSPSAEVGPLVTAAASAGNATAVELLRRLGHWLGVGIAAVVSALDPGVVVIGGGVSAAGELLLGPTRDSYRESVAGRGHRPLARIVPAALGNDAGLIGAATLSMERLPVGSPE